MFFNTVGHEKWSRAEVQNFELSSSTSKYQNFVLQPLCSTLCIQLRSFLQNASSIPSFIQHHDRASCIQLRAFWTATCIRQRTFCTKCASKFVHSETRRASNFRHSETLGASHIRLPEARQKSDSVHSEWYHAVAKEIQAKTCKQENDWLFCVACWSYRFYVASTKLSTQSIALTFFFVLMLPLASKT